jgi:hypothetical protein
LERLNFRNDDQLENSLSSANVTSILNAIPYAARARNAAFPRLAQM